MELSEQNGAGWPSPPHRNLGAYVLGELGRRIVSGAVAPGAQLPNESDLAVEFGVSKTVVREAIRGLAAKGLVAARPKLGTRVLELDRWQTLDPDVLLWRVASGANDEFLSDLDEFRAAVEPMTARLAAMRADGKDLASLQDAFARMSAAADDDAAFFQADVEFHALLIAATHNLLLNGLREAVKTALRVRHRSAAAVEHDNRASVPFHQAVLDAVVARDPATAEKAMHALLAISSLGVRPSVTGPDQLLEPGSRSDR